MRLSVNQNDPGYPAWLALHRRNVAPIVTVDGVMVRHCLTADTKRGIAVVADADVDGQIKFNIKRGEVKRKVLHGRVTIEMA